MRSSLRPWKQVGVTMTFDLVNLNPGSLVGFDVNFIDDVGQTILNWASAFGTYEMVEYLLEHGADVNRGLKSSSLHYAACFGRPNIVKLLLQYGADPDLRDEDCHTPLEKAQERGDEWHRQVIEILENPSEWCDSCGRVTVWVCDCVSCVECVL